MATTNRPSARHCPQCGAMGILPLDQPQGPTGAIKDPVMTDRLAMGAGYTDHGLVFAQPDGGAVNPESVAKRFDRLVAKCTLPRIRFHDLRHTHVAHLIAAGEQPLLIARRVGHASSSFTMDRYGHLFEAADSQAASAVAAMVDSAVVTKL